MAPRRSSSLATSNKRHINKQSKRRKPKRPSTQVARKVCLFCEKIWPTYWNLEMHMNIHTKERPYECQYCDANFSFLSAQLVHQNNVHLGKRYYCNLCTKSFTAPSNLVAHRRKDHHSQSKRAIFNGIQKVTKEIGILKGKRNKMREVRDENEDSAKKMPVVVKKAVPTTSQLFNLVNSLQKVTQRKRKISGGEEQVSENGAPVKHRRENGLGQVPVEVNEEISKGSEETVVEIKDELEQNVNLREGEVVVEQVKEEVALEGENVTELSRATSSLFQPNNEQVSVKQEKDEDNQSVPHANKNESTNQNKTPSKQLGQPTPPTSSFPSLVNMNWIPYVAGLPSQQSPDICWYNRPPEPPPNLMFCLNGHTVPVLSLDILRNLSRSNRPRPPPSSPSPPASQSSSSDPDYSPPPKAATSSRKQSTSSNKSTRKKINPEPSTSSQRQSTKLGDKKNVPRQTKNSLKSTETNGTRKLKRRKKGPNSAVHRRNRNYPNKCEQCDETFKYPSKLALHMIKHTGERPFPCTLCGVRFTRKGNLNQHMMNIHSENNLPAVKVEDVKTEGSSES